MLISNNLKDIVEVYKTADGIDNESDHIRSFHFQRACLVKIETQHYSRVACIRASLLI